MNADCPDCARPLTHDRGGMGACHECNIRVPVAQCEVCGDQYPEDALEFVSEPGATLAFCDDCTQPEARP